MGCAILLFFIVFSLYGSKGPDIAPNVSMLDRNLLDDRVESPSMRVCGGKLVELRKFSRGFYRRNMQ